MFRLFQTLFLSLVCMFQVACGVQSSNSDALQFLKNMKAKDYFNGPLEIKLAEAIEKESLEDISVLLNEGVDINARGVDGITPLFWAALKQKPASFKLLLESGANPNIIAETKVKEKLYPDRPDTRKLPLMELLSTMDDPSYLRLALKHDGTPNTIAEYAAMVSNATVLFTAIRKGAFENVITLVENGAKVNYRNAPYPNTPLEEARKQSRYDIVKYLIEQGADPSMITGTRKNGSEMSFASNLERAGVYNLFGMPEEDFSAQRGHYLDVVNYLKQKGLLDKDFDPWFREKQGGGNIEIIEHETRPLWWPDFPETETN